MTQKKTQEQGSNIKHSNKSYTKKEGGTERQEAAAKLPKKSKKSANANDTESDWSE
jgi:hypothetical protein